MTDDTDFSNAPVSLAEARATKAHRANLWTPRDLLVSLLREIDSGKVKPHALVIAFHEAPDENGDTRTSYRMSASGAHEALGLIEAAKLRMWMER